MKKDTAYVKVDSRNRVTIPKDMAKERSDLYKIYEKGGLIILEPIIEVPLEEMWLFDPKNKAIVATLKKALKQKAHKTIDLSSFEKK
jgi:hypothetical protein